MRLAALLIAALASPALAGFDPPSEAAGPPKVPEAAAAAARGGFTYGYPEAQDSRYRALRSAFMHGRLLERLTESLNAAVAVPRELKLEFAQCGQTNAFYSPDESSVTICYELIVDFQKKFAEQAKKDPKALKSKTVERAVAGALSFVIYHELGHALIDILNIPATGKEEDAVDQLAAVILMQASKNGEEAALAAATALGDLGGRLDESDFADVHSVGPQRFYNITCWVYGENPMARRNLVTGGTLPRDRAASCGEEWERMSGAWNSLLGAHLKEAPGTRYSSL